MRGFRLTRQKLFCLFLTVITAIPVAASERPTRGYEVEVFRYDVAPNVVLGKNAQQALSARLPFGEPGVDAYVVVIRLAPGERFVSAHAEVRDGFFCIPRRRGTGLARRVAARMGYHVVLQSAPSEIAKTLGLVAELVPLTPKSALPPPRLRKRVQLQAKDVEHHDGYVAALLLVASNPLTRMQIERVVTRAKKPGGKRRSRGPRTVSLPPSDSAMPRDRIMSILAGEDDR